MSSGEHKGEGPGAWNADEEEEMKRLANEALRSINAAKTGSSQMHKSPSTEILEKYNRQPLHVRSRAEQWELLRSEIKLAGKLGEGDGGVIYHAHWRGLDVVAKMLKTEADEPRTAITSEIARADLINEISVLSRLRHPNLVMFLGACTIGEPLVILNEFMSGGNLEDFLHKRRKDKGGRPFVPPPKMVLRWSGELARALCFLHNCTPTIIHRDLKPANLLLNEDGHMKVGDFELSKVKDMQKVNGTYRMTGKTGSMRYMAPEVFQDDPLYDEKVDIYSTGLIMWYIAVGERPFDRVPADVVADKAAHSGLRPDLEPIKSTLGAEFASITEWCWHADAGRRPSAAELVDLLEAWGKGVKDRKDAKNCCLS